MLVPFVFLITLYGHPSNEGHMPSDLSIFLKSHLISLSWDHTPLSAHLWP